MKKIIATLFALFIVLSVSAQIQRNFYGFTIGYSSYSTMKQILNNQNARFIDRGNELILVYQSFGNIDWKGVVMDCNGGQFNSITFIKDDASQSDFNYVYALLNRKYNRYLYRSDSNSYMYVDGRTIASVTLDNGQLSLLYKDKQYMENGINRDMNSY